MYYIGTKAIKTVRPATEPRLDLEGEVEVVIVEYEDGDQELMPSWEFTAARTTEVTDDSEVRNSVANAVASEILKLLLEMDVKITYINHIFQKVETSLNVNYRSAVDRLFGMEDRKVRMNTVNEVLKTAPIPAVMASSKAGSA